MTAPAAASGTVRLGDLVVPRMGFGTMRLTGPGVSGPPADRDEAIRVVRRAAELGVGIFDCSWYYGPYTAHEVVAEALYPYAADVVLVTKLGAARGRGGSWHAALTPKELRAGNEADLRLLRLDSIPVTHLRWADNSRATFADALGAMVDLQREGRIQRIGLSAVTVGQLDIALRHTEVVTVSNAYSVIDRRDEAVVERCGKEGIAYLPWFPLGGGSVARGTAVRAYDAVREIADRRRLTPTQVALAWLLHRSPVMLPIPGTSQVPIWRRTSPPRPCS
jgi:aryl-alcohol dehydrogenase-like predicted oxidoreductase